MKGHTLITGGGGFIGHHLVKSFGDERKILVLDNFVRGIPERLKDCGSNVKVLKCDITNNKELKDCTKPINIDCIYHLAAINGTGNFYKIPVEIMDVGILGCYNILKLAKDLNVRKCIIASSAEVYQNPEKIPTKEDVVLKIPSYKNPRYSYALSKIYTEYYAYHFSLQHNINTSIFRPHNVYGPDMGLQHVIPQFIMQFLDMKDNNNIKIRARGSIDSTRAFVFVEDVIKGMKILEDIAPSVDVFNIGSNEQIEIQEIVSCIGLSLKKEFSILCEDEHIGSTPKRCPDISKIKNLGYKPNIKFQEGLNITLDWYIQNYNVLKKINKAFY